MKKFFIIFILSMFVVTPIKAETNIKSENLEEALKREGIDPLFDKLIENDKQIPFYIFINSGEEKSINLLKFLNNIYEDYGQYIKIVSYEVTLNPDNLQLMNNTITYLDAKVTDIPFMVMGDAYFTTYNESLNNSIIDTINMYKDSEDYYNGRDKVQEVLSKYYRNDSLIIGIVISSVIILISLFIYAAFKGRKKEN